MSADAKVFPEDEQGVLWGYVNDFGPVGATGTIGSGHTLAECLRQCEERAGGLMRWVFREHGNGPALNGYR